MLKAESTAWPFRPTEIRVLYTQRCADGSDHPGCSIPICLKRWTDHQRPDVPALGHLGGWCLQSYFRGRLSRWKISPAGKDIMAGEPYDSPLMPFGGLEEIAWTPDGKGHCLYLQETGRDSTIPSAPIRTSTSMTWKRATPRNLTEGMPGYDKAPFFSPDGKKMYWLSMETGRI